VFAQDTLGWQVHFDYEIDEKQHIQSFIFFTKMSSAVSTGQTASAAQSIYLPPLPN